MSSIDIPEPRNARWIRKRFKKKKYEGGLGKRLDLLSDGFHSSGGVSGFPSNPITTVKCDLGSWPYAAHHETPWAFHISSGPDTNRGAPGILSLQPAAAMGVFRTVEGIKFSKRAPIPPGFCTERNRIGFRENGDQATVHWTKNDWFSIKREILLFMIIIPMVKWVVKKWSILGSIKRNEVLIFDLIIFLVIKSWDIYLEYDESKLFVILGYDNKNFFFFFFFEIK